MTKVLADGGATVNLMPYTTYQKLGKTSKDLIKTYMTLKDFSDNPSQARGILNMEPTSVLRLCLPLSLLLMGRDLILCPSSVTGSMPNVAFLLPCINA